MYTLMIKPVDLLYVLSFLIGHSYQVSSPIHYIAVCASTMHVRNKPKENEYIFKHFL